MFCRNCGNNNPDGAPYCQRCGTSMMPATYAPRYAPAPVVPGKGLGIASMVLGIVSLAFICIPWITIVCAIIGAVLGGVAIYKAKQVRASNGMAVAGLVCSVISLFIAVVVLIYAMAVYDAITFWD